MDVALKLALDDHDLRFAWENEDLKVLVAYENAAAGNHALAVLNRVARGIEGPSRLACVVWKFETLDEPLLRQTAAGEATAADIIVIAAEQAAELPPAVLEWVSLWLSRRTVRPMALGIILTGVQDSAGGAADKYLNLKEAARLGGLDFFTTGGGETKDPLLSLVVGQLASRNRGIWWPAMQTQMEQARADGSACCPHARG